MAAPTNSPPPTTYGATATTFITTTISLLADQPSFTILYPEPGTYTGDIQYTTFPVITGLSSTYTPSPLPILILTNVVGIAVNPSGSPIATRTLLHLPPPPYATSSPAPPQTSTCLAWKCWSRTTDIGICIGASLGFLVLVLSLWWIFIRHPRIKKIRIRKGRPGDGQEDEEKDLALGGGRPPLKISVSTSMSQMRSVKGGREGSLTPSPTPKVPIGGRRGEPDDGIRVVAGSRVGRVRAGSVGASDVPAYRVLRQPSPREFVRSVGMPEGPVAGDDDAGERGRDRNRGGETRFRDFAATGVGAAAAGGMRSAMREGRRGSVLEGDMRFPRGESMRAGSGSRRDRRGIEAEFQRGDHGERRMDRDRAQRPGNNRRRSQSHQPRSYHGSQVYGERRRERQADDDEERRPRCSYAPNDEEDFEVRRDRNSRQDRSPSKDRSPRRRDSGRDEQKRRPRSVSHDRDNPSNDKQRKRRNSESGGIGAGLKKLMPLLPLVLGLMTTYAEPKGGWEQYIPEEKRKGKGKLKKMAEDIFDKHHHKIPEDFPRHLYNPSSIRSKSADRAHQSSRNRENSPSPRHRRETLRARDLERNPGESSRAASHRREGRHEHGSVDSKLSPSPPPRRHRSTRDRRPRGYDGADDEHFVDYGDKDGIVNENAVENGKAVKEEIARPYEITESDVPLLDLRGAKTFPLAKGGWERWEEIHESRGFRYMVRGDMPPSPPSTVR